MKRTMDSHLIAVEVRIKGGTNERVNLDGLAFNENRLECLNPKSMQRWSAIEQNRMVLDDFFKNVPYYRILPLDHFLGGLDSRAMSALFEPVIDERFKQLQCHLLRQPALMQLQLGADYNDRAAGIIHALSEQILAEAAPASYL